MELKLSATMVQAVRRDIYSIFSYLTGEKVEEGVISGEIQEELNDMCLRLCAIADDYRAVLESLKHILPQDKIADKSI